MPINPNFYENLQPTGSFVAWKHVDEVSDICVFCFGYDRNNKSLEARYWVENNEELRLGNGYHAVPCCKGGDGRGAIASLLFFAKKCPTAPLYLWKQTSRRSAGFMHLGGAIINLATQSTKEGPGCLYNKHIISPHHRHWQDEKNQHSN